MNERRIVFLADFRWKPTPQTARVFKAGETAFVPLLCAEMAIAKGKARPSDLAGPPAGIAAMIGRTVRKRAPRKRTDAGE